MFDAMDIEAVVLDVECEQHPVVAVACRAQAQEFVRERLAELARIIGQNPGDESDHRGSSLPR
ncbi:hypothetical protein [Arthrobacter burdickii]|uniref:Uncharacterized protein n=1 Tax=Arthrobacter burdickii TaxID=3035920 RepID=A0ABT8JXJ1_9MICC|nr:hypothetical protein [Arthrobacter burdickii]MDN4609893.1 hypothetical protein [Arthrobacter burdickii]